MRKFNQIQFAHRIPNFIWNQLLSLSLLFFVFDGVSHRLIYPNKLWFFLEFFLRLVFFIIIRHWVVRLWNIYRSDCSASILQTCCCFFFTSWILRWLLVFIGMSRGLTVRRSDCKSLNDQKKKPWLAISRFINTKIQRAANCFVFALNFGFWPTKRDEHHILDVKL